MKDFLKQNIIGFSIGIYFMAIVLLATNFIVDHYFPKPSMYCYGKVDNIDVCFATEWLRDEYSKGSFNVSAPIDGEITFCNKDCPKIDVTKIVKQDDSIKDWMCREITWCPPSDWYKTNPRDVCTYSKEFFEVGGQDPSWKRINGYCRQVPSVPRNGK